MKTARFTVELLCTLGGLLIGSGLLCGWFLPLLGGSTAFVDWFLCAAVTGFILFAVGATGAVVLSDYDKN